MTSVPDAVGLILARTPVLPPETAPLAACPGRILRESVLADTDLPRTDRATMDGYVVRADESAPRRRIARTAATDDEGVGDLEPGTAVRVSTGTALRCTHPSRVIPFECVTVDGDTLSCDRQTGRDHIHRQGADARAGDRLLTSGDPLTPGRVALLASLGREAVRVSRPLRIRHYTTGDEIIARGEPLRAGGVFDSNGPLIASLLAALGEAARTAHLSEDYATALHRVRADFAAEKPDLLLISGGSGPGAGDFTAKLLSDLGYNLALREGVRVRPGKPLLFGTCGDGVAFGLPGNPLSHWASFHTFVIPAVERLRGETPRRHEVRASLEADAPDLADPRPTYHPATVRWVDGVATVSLIPWSASGNVRVMADANAIVAIPPGTHALRAGDPITATLIPSALHLF